MTSTLNGEARTAAKTAAGHIAEGERWLNSAERTYRATGSDMKSDNDVRIEQKFAELHFLAATAVDIDREADAEQRIASCVPAGGSALDVNMRGQR